MEPEQSPANATPEPPSASKPSTQAVSGMLTAFSRWKWGLLIDPTLIGWTILLIILTVQFIKGNLMGDTTLKLELYEIYIFLFLAILYTALLSIIVIMISMYVKCFSGLNILSSLNAFTSLLTGSLQCANINT